MPERLAAPSTARELARRLPAPVRAALLARPPRRRAFDRFVRPHAEDVRGVVLELGGSRVTRRLGGARVTRSEVLDVRPGNLEATIVADLAEPGALPEGAFDCLLLSGVTAAELANAGPALAPGGVLLATFPAGEPVLPVGGVVDLGRGLAGIRLVRR